MGDEELVLALAHQHVNGLRKGAKKWVTRAEAERAGVFVTILSVDSEDDWEPPAPPEVSEPTAAEEPAETVEQPELLTEPPPQIV